MASKRISSRSKALSSKENPPLSFIWHLWSIVEKTACGTDPSDFQSDLFPECPPSFINYFVQFKEKVGPQPFNRLFYCLDACIKGNLSGEEFQEILKEIFVNNPDPVAYEILREFSLDLSEIKTETMDLDIGSQQDRSTRRENRNRKKLELQAEDPTPPRRSVTQSRKARKASIIESHSEDEEEESSQPERKKKRKWTRRPKKEPKISKKMLPAVQEPTPINIRRTSSPEPPRQSLVQSMPESIQAHGNPNPQEQESIQIVEKNIQESSSNQKEGPESESLFPESMSDRPMKFKRMRKWKPTPHVPLKSLILSPKELNKIFPRAEKPKKKDINKRSKKLSKSLQIEIQVENSPVKKVKRKSKPKWTPPPRSPKACTSTSTNWTDTPRLRKKKDDKKDATGRREKTVPKRFDSTKNHYAIEIEVPIIMMSSAELRKWKSSPKPFFTPIVPKPRTIDLEPPEVVEVQVTEPKSTTPLQGSSQTQSHPKHMFTMEEIISYLGMTRFSGDYYKSLVRKAFEESGPVLPMSAVLQKISKYQESD